MTFIPNINNTPLTAFGDARTAELSPIFQGSFESTVDNTELNINTVTGGGTVTQGSAMALVGTSITTASTSKLISARLAKYRAGLGASLRFTTLFSPGVAGTEQFIGIMDEAGSGAAFKNGLAVGFAGTIFGFHRFVNDTLVTVPQTAWDDPLDGTGKSGLNLDVTKINVWFITFQYLGAGGIDLCCELPSKEIVLVHTIQYAGLFTTPHSFNPNYHFTMFANNGATTSDIQVASSSYGFFIEGKTHPIQVHQPQFSSEEQSKTTVTAEVAIFTIRCKDLYAGKTNFVEILLELLTASSEAASANNLGTIRVIKNATITTPIYTDINTTNSVVEIDTVGTISGGKEVMTFPLAGKDDAEILNIVNLQIVLLHGDTITLAGSSTNSATIKAGLLWKELF